MGGKKCVAKCPWQGTYVDADPSSCYYTKHCANYKAPRTKADTIRSMNDNQLAEFLTRMTQSFDAEVWKRWLQEEEEEK